MAMSVDEKYQLVTRNLQEVISKEELKKGLNKKDFSVYWGTMPTGSVSLAYFFPMLKIADFLKAGLKVKILLADLHAALDGVQWDILDKRFKYYERAVTLILKTIGVDFKKLEFVKGSDIQLNSKYFNDLLRLSTYTSFNRGKKAASEGIKSAVGDDARLAGFIYPLMQALDEEYLKVDAQFAGVDQRKIMVYAREYLPKMGYKARIELMNPMIRGLIGEKMSSSVEHSKIDLLDDEEKVKSKINQAECVGGNPDNGIMALLKYFIFVIKEDKNEEFVVERLDKYGGNLIYKDYNSLEKDFIAKKIHPLDLKNALAKEINKLLEPIRKDKKIHELYKNAYC
ncbi:MAG: tyrosine--tRNA ligase [Nanoarchaeota archaeon]|nr:tyrosine--tRNA ligase [Nanoarchaeota archaeon]